ncbi:MAG: M48 family metallopeptidase [Planctomycetes bacterium]|nr:M48 family metallopeptidase [Planctomycetota bacterium]
MNTQPPKPDATPSAIITFNDLIAQNKRNSALLMAGMMTLGFLVIGFAVLALSAHATGDVSVGQVVFSSAVGVIVVGVAGLWSYYGGAQSILSASGAQPIEKNQDPQLFNVVEELAIAAGIPMPKVYLIGDEALNAFATGRDPEHAAVAITTGLREKLTRDELAGVIAHELSHVRHYDIRLMMLVATMAGTIVLANDVMWRSMRVRSGRRSTYSSSSSNQKGGNPLVIVIVVIAVVLAIVAPIVATLIQFAVSRQREYLADAGAVELTRNPKGLADALRKLAEDKGVLDHANRATAHLYIVNPFNVAAETMNMDSPFATHPPIAQRIARIESLMR